MDNTTHPLSTPYFTASSVASFINSLCPTPKLPVGSLAAATEAAPPPIDILLTHTWPSMITHGSAKQPSDPTASDWGAPVIAEILSATKPRYHFSSEKPIYWEREPFEFTNNTYTRFISLGEFANKSKERWFYAFNLAPIATGSIQPRPVNVTPCPLSSNAIGKFAPASRGMKRAFGQVENEEPSNYIFGGGTGKNKPPPKTYVCKICSQPGHWIQECPEASQSRGKKSQRKDITPDECWFCLLNPKVTKHLIASIGNECYLTLPKGQLPDANDSATPVPGGGHVLIIPIGHYGTLRSIPADVSVSVNKELAAYKNALKTCYAEHSASMVTFEVGRSKGGHAHVQVCPIPNTLADKVAMTFHDEGSKEGYSFEEDGDDVLRSQNITDNYFRVELPDGRVLVHILSAGKPFNLQFGRTTLATLMGMSSRADWKVCAGAEAEEKAECTAFKAVFKKFDPAQ